ncbi:hypothetical protein GIB67_038071 [Kingdonia uniflora]|uniref:Uncharacterized protein n=1 Tax=Kingdonia uniflora TaxID=39325 RepID=A0A7J7MMC3_9MAGN|nr:hypothetical protein GIB67_038071 [Kingdonia uniflora]
MVIEELDEKETLKVTWVKLFWIHLFYIILEPPEGSTFLDGLDISLLLFKPAPLYICDETWIILCRKSDTSAEEQVAIQKMDRTAFLKMDGTAV